MKKIFSTLNMIILFSSLYGVEVSANNIIQFNPAGLKPVFTNYSVIKSNNTTGMSVKNSGAYDESKDPLMRRGTQNTDTPQGIFFAIPFILTVVVFIVLFSKRK